MDVRLDAGSMVDPGGQLAEGEFFEVGVQQSFGGQVAGGSVFRPPYPVRLVLPFVISR